MKTTFMEYLIDISIETRLFEMAYSRTKAKTKVDNLSPQIFEHMVKLFTLDSQLTRNHWFKEIDSMLYQYDKLRLKPSNKRIEYRHLVEWFFNYGATFSPSDIPKLIKFWKLYDYSTIAIISHSKDEVFNNVSRILKEVFIDIENDEYVTIQDYF